MDQKLLRATEAGHNGPTPQGVSAILSPPEGIEGRFWPLYPSGRHGQPGGHQGFRGGGSDQRTTGVCLPGT